MAEVGGVAGDRLRTIIERIERLEDEKKALSDDEDVGVCTYNSPQPVVLSTSFFNVERAVHPF